MLRDALLTEVEGLDLDHHLELWQRVYWEICGVEPRLTDIELPEDPGGFGWPIVATPEVPLGKLWNALGQKFTCWCYGGDDLEGLLDWNKQERSYKNGAYAIRVRDCVEADEELQNLSANMVEGQKLRTVTLDERVRLEAFYWTLSSGQHLDVQNVTLCAGSRGCDGSVPSAGWHAGFREFRVRWCYPGGRSGFLRPRAAVS